MTSLSRLAGALILLLGLAGTAAAQATASNSIDATIGSGSAPGNIVLAFHSGPPFAGPPPFGPPPWAGPPHHRDRWARCEHRAASWVIGRRAAPWIVEQARRSARARTARLIRPGEFYTQEYDRSRLTIEVNRRNRIIDVRCG